MNRLDSLIYSVPLLSIIRASTKIMFTGIYYWGVGLEQKKSGVKPRTNRKERAYCLLCYLRSTICPVFAVANV